ncbi:MAG: urease accessory UreF family protein [Pseudomonadota bacterium]
MSTELLRLVQWLSPAFPLGSYAYSHGLETAVNRGGVSDGETLAAWLDVLIARGSGRNDAILIGAARRGEDVEDLAKALAASKERLEETMAQGAAFAANLRALGLAARAGPLPVVLGRAVAEFEADNATITALYLQSFASNLVQCAVRYVPLGQSVGQRVLSDLAPRIDQTARETAGQSTDDIYSGAFLSDIAAMAHERETARLFKT